VKFIKLVRSKLKVHDETIRDRFGIIDYLMNIDYIGKMKTPEKDFISDLSMPEISDFKLIDFNKPDEKNILDTILKIV